MLVKNHGVKRFEREMWVINTNKTINIFYKEESEKLFTCSYLEWHTVRNEIITENSIQLV